LEKTLEAVYRQRRGVLWRRQVLLSCKLINKCFKKKVWFLYRTDHVSSESGRIIMYKPYPVFHFMDVGHLHDRIQKTILRKDMIWLVNLTPEHSDTF
jgi:hypothetical protein